VYVFCFVTGVGVCFLFCGCGGFSVFCIVTVVGVRVLYCDSGRCTCFVL
jgi:hypothetical protein